MDSGHFKSPNISAKDCSWPPVTYFLKIHSMFFLTNISPNKMPSTNDTKPDWLMQDFPHQHCSATFASAVFSQFSQEEKKIRLLFATVVKLLFCIEGWSEQSWSNQHFWFLSECNCSDAYFKMGFSSISSYKIQNIQALQWNAFYIRYSI